MELMDIRISIFEQIDDVKTLISFCNVDKENRQLCSTRAFWVKQFNKYNLLLLNINYIESRDWMEEFLTRYYVKNY